MTVPSNSPFEKVPFGEAWPQQEIHILARVDRHFKMRSCWDDLHDDPSENRIVYMAYLVVRELMSPLDCEVELDFHGDDGVELLRACESSE